MENAQKLKELIEQVDKILITSHVAPDPDSISSILLLGTTLRTNYPDKIILTSSEELLDELDFLTGYDRIQQAPLLEVVENADLIILVDAMNFERASRKDGQAINQKVKERNIPLVIIDHHEPVGVVENQIYINRDFPSAVQEVYEVLFNDLELKKPEGYAQTTMVGVYSDTGGFTYINKQPDKTLGLIGELIKAGVEVQHIKNKLNQYSSDSISVLKELLNNCAGEDSYTYSFLRDEFVTEWMRQGKSISDLNAGISLFTSQYVRNIDGRIWGFVVYKNPLLEDHEYSVSLRSLSGHVDVAAIAARLNGGGHKPAAGGKVEASDISEALQLVKATITQVRI